MAFKSVGTTISDNNFVKNGVNLGLCDPTQSLNVSGNYFDTAPFDDACAKDGDQPNDKPAGTSLKDVGPRP